MFPNWIYYILGKKSGGDTPTPPTPVETPVVFSDGMKFGNSTWQTIPDFVKNGDFSEMSDLSRLVVTNAYLTEFVLSEETSHTTKNATSLQNMFDGCGQLKKVGWFDTSSVTTMNSTFFNCSNLEGDIPLFDTSKVTSMLGCFYNCRKITKIPQFDTSSNQTFNGTFSSCYGLTDFPLLDASKVTNFGSMFSGVGNLSDTSLDNILQMCIGATSYNSYKGLDVLGLSSGYDSRIVNLPHYQDFLAAGWIIR